MKRYVLIILCAYPLICGFSTYINISNVLGKAGKYSQAEIVPNKHMFEALFVLVFDGASAVTNADYLFSVTGDHIIVWEPMLQDSPRQKVQRALFLDVVGVTKCKDKYNPAAYPSIAYFSICATLRSWNGNAFVVDETTSLLGTRAGEEKQVFQSTVSIVISQNYCKARLLSYQRSFGNSHGVYYKPVSMKSQQCNISLD